MREIKREFSDRLPEIYGSTFPYFGSGDGLRRFKGRNNLLKGYTGKAKTDVVLDNGEVAISVPEGTKFLDIHFETRQRAIQNGEMSQVMEVLHKGVQDSLDLINELQINPKLSDVDIIAGKTNSRMAKIAVQKIGFHYAGTEELVRQSKTAAKIYSEMVTIYITKDELIRKREKLLDLNTRLSTFRVIRGGRVA